MNLTERLTRYGISERKDGTLVEASVGGSLQREIREVSVRLFLLGSCPTPLRALGTGGSRGLGAHTLGTLRKNLWLSPALAHPAPLVFPALAGTVDRPNQFILIERRR